MSEQKEAEYRKKLEKTVRYLKKKKNVLFLTTSNRWEGYKHEIPKSSMLAELIAEKLGNKNVKIIDVTKLKIYPCEGNVSLSIENICGVKDALLKDRKKNPSGYHRCWNSIHNKDDELWKISRELFKSDCVVFFGCVRWGQMNSYYQKIIERLTWIENRHSTLKGDNVVKNIDAGIITIGQNWRGKEIIGIQKIVLNSYGFKVIPALCWSWQFTKNSSDETQESYKKAFPEFKKTFFK